MAGKIPNAQQIAAQRALPMHGSNPILIQILWRIAASGLRGTIIRQRAMQKAGNLMQTQHMTMNSGSIHPLQK